MPGRFIAVKKKGGPVRYVRRKRAGAGMRRRAGPRYYRPAKGGGFTITRKLPVITLTSSGSLGSTSLNDPTGTCLAVGPASASPGSSTTFDVPFAMKFSLDQLLSSSDITQIADQYKINSVMVRVSNAYQVATGLATAAPYIEYIQDYDDATVPNLNIIRTKMGVRTKYFGPLTNKLVMGVRPKWASELYSSGITTAYSPRQGFLDCNNASVEHYGIKGILHNMALPASVNSGTFTFDISFSVTAKDLQ